MHLALWLTPSTHYTVALEDGFALVARVRSECRPGAAKVGYVQMLLVGLHPSNLTRVAREDGSSIRHVVDIKDVQLAAKLLRG